MKLYVWEGPGVLQDWTCGMICAIGDSLKEALSAVETECDYCLESFPKDNPTSVVDLGDNCPAQARAWVCWGGG